MQKRDHEFNVLCRGFQHMATRTWHRIRNNHTKPISIREDGITALNLQDLYELQSHEFTVVDFSPHVESSTTGADWEWWFMQPGRNFGAAVQAKALSKALDYDIAYVPKKGYHQIARLLDYSRAKGLTPMYCFYNWWSVPPMEHWPCGSFREQDDLWGCALADGHTVWRLHRQDKHSLSDIHRHTMPWHCIVCCPGRCHGGPMGPGTRAAGIARFLRSREAEKETPQHSQEPDQYAEFPEPEIVAELPERISVLRHVVQCGEEVGSKMIHKLFGETPPKQVILQGRPDKE